MVVNLTPSGAVRVLNGSAGMTFVVDSLTLSGDGKSRVAHVRDYRYPNDFKPYQVWSLSEGDYVEVNE